MPAVKMCHVSPHDGWTCNGSPVNWGGEGRRGLWATRDLLTEQSSPPRTGPSRARAPATTARRGLARPFAMILAEDRWMAGVITVAAPWAPADARWRPFCGCSASPPGARSHRTDRGDGVGVFNCRGDAAARRLTWTDAGARPFLERFSHTQKEVSRRHKRFVDSIPHRSSPISFLNSSPWVGVPHPLPMWVLIICALFLSLSPESINHSYPILSGWPLLAALTWPDRPSSAQDLLFCSGQVRWRSCCSLCLSLPGLVTLLLPLWVCELRGGRERVLSCLFRSFWVRGFQSWE